MTLSIRNRLLLGFGILLVLVALIFSITMSTVNNSRRISQQITENYSPSVIVLQRLHVAGILQQHATESDDRNTNVLRLKGCVAPVNQQLTRGLQPLVCIRFDGLTKQLFSFGKVC